MKSEKIDKYIGERVRITFFDNSQENILISQHIVNSYINYRYYKDAYYGINDKNEIIIFKKSHVKKIEVIR